MRDMASVRDGDAVSGRSYRPPLTDGDDRSIEVIFQASGLRVTRQRVSLVRLLFCKGIRHLTAAMLFEEAAQCRVRVSMATVYNTLHQLTDAGFLRRVSIDGTKTYFDTNPSAHHHFYLENNYELVNIPGPCLVLQTMPELPDGYEVARIDIVVRLRRKQPS
jgi:Fur family transcriptional regulator, iron response regulator